MLFTIESVILVAGVITACATIITTGVKLVRWIDRQKKQDTELQHIRDEQATLVYGLWACLDGLRQLGADGDVDEAKTALTKYVNKAAHKGAE